VLQSVDVENSELLALLIGDTSTASASGTYDFSFGWKGVCLNAFEQSTGNSGRLCWPYVLPSDTIGILDFPFDSQEGMYVCGLFGQILQVIDVFVSSTFLYRRMELYLGGICLHALPLVIYGSASSLTSIFFFREEKSSRQDGALNYNLWSFASKSCGHHCYCNQLCDTGKQVCGCQY
jgi:hypothetical protein